MKTKPKGKGDYCNQILGVGKQMGSGKQPSSTENAEILS